MSAGNLRLRCPVVNFRPTCRMISAMSSEQDKEEVTINCVAIFYEEGKGGENFIEEN